jgi:alanine racemase
MPLTHHASRVALISRSSLESNLRELGADDLTVDLSADAFGHSCAIVVPLFRELGVKSFTVSRESDRVRLRALFPKISIDISPVDDAMVSQVYGLTSAKEARIRPVMTLLSEVVAVKSIEAGGGVSYGYTWRAPVDGWLALSSLGYADGFNRAWGNRVSARVGRAIFPAVGRVAMDAHTVSTGSKKLSPGDLLTYFGGTDDEAVFAQEFADCVGSSPVSVTTNLNSRIIRVVN